MPCAAKALGADRDGPVPGSSCAQVERRRAFSLSKRRLPRHRKRLPGLGRCGNTARHIDRMETRRGQGRTRSQGSISVRMATSSPSTSSAGQAAQLPSPARKTTIETIRRHEQKVPQYPAQSYRNCRLCSERISSLNASTHPRTCSAVARSVSRVNPKAPITRVV